MMNVSALRTLIICGIAASLFTGCVTVSNNYPIASAPPTTAQPTPVYLTADGMHACQCSHCGTITQHGVVYVPQNNHIYPTQNSSQQQNQSQYQYSDRDYGPNATGSYSGRYPTNDSYGYDRNGNTSAEGNNPGAKAANGSYAANESTGRDTVYIQAPPQTNTHTTERIIVREESNTTRDVLDAAVGVLGTILESQRNSDSDDDNSGHTGGSTSNGNGGGVTGNSTMGGRGRTPGITGSQSGMGGTRSSGNTGNSGSSGNSTMGGYRGGSSGQSSTVSGGIGGVRRAEEEPSSTSGKTEPSSHVNGSGNGTVTASAETEASEREPMVSARNGSVSQNGTVESGSSKERETTSNSQSSPSHVNGSTSTVKVSTPARTTSNTNESSSGSASHSTRSSQSGRITVPVVTPDSKSGGMITVPRSETVKVETETSTESPERPMLQAPSTNSPSVIVNERASASAGGGMLAPKQ